MPQNAAKELLQDRNNNQQIDIDDIKSNIKNFHDMKSLAKEIKEKTFEVIKGFYEENKEALTELDDDEMKILTL